MALFEVAAVASGAITVVPLLFRAVKEWLQLRRSEVHVNVTLSSGEELSITASNVDANEILQLLNRLRDEEQATQDETLPNGEGQ